MATVTTKRTLHAVEGSPQLLPQHEKLIQDSGISPEVASRRRYQSLDGSDGLLRLRSLGFASSACRVPGLLIPLCDGSPEPRGYQYRPDSPRRSPGRRKKGQISAPFIKYETPTDQGVMLDVPPGQQYDERGETKRLDSKDEPLWVTEGSRKVDAAISAGGVAIGVLGVTMWHTEDWKMLRLSGRDVYLAFDSDHATNKAVSAQLQKLGKMLLGLGARVHYCVIPNGPNGEKVGLDDYLADGGTLESLMRESQDDAPPPVVTSPDGRPPLDVTHEAVLFDFLRARLGRGALTGVFLRDGRPVRAVAIGEDGYIAGRDGEDDGPAQVHPVTPSVLQGLLQMAYYTHKVSGPAERRVSVPAIPSRQACGIALDVAVESDVPRLRGVTHAPVVLRSGEVMDTPGYDEASKLLYLPGDLVVPKLPRRTSRADRDAARDLLLGLLADFPFESDSDRANYLGLLLTPLLRLVRPEPWPLFAINAPMSGSGKSLLAEVARIIHGGVVRSELPDSDDEVRKSITSILLSTTGPVVTFDNVDRVVRSSELASLLTGPTWSDRYLGQNRHVTLPNDRVWTVTGNNIRLDGDLPRRTVWVTIDPKRPNPERRTDIAITDLPGHVREHRGEIIAALLTLVRWWVRQKRAGRVVVTVERTDSFGQWGGTVASILDAAGVGGRFLDPATNRAEKSKSDEEWERVLAALYAEIGGRQFTSREAYIELTGRADVDEVLPYELAQDRHLNQARTIASFGQWIVNRQGRFAGEYVVRNAGKRHGSNVWEVSRLGGG